VKRKKLYVYNDDMKRKYSDDEIIRRINLLKSIKACDSFEKNMHLNGYEDLIPHLFKKRIYLRKEELEGKIHFDVPEETTTQFINDFFNALAAYEEVLSLKNERRTIAVRLRQSIKRHGLKKALIRVTSKKTFTYGFRYLVENSFEEFTLENVILNNKELFDKDHVAFIKKKLEDI